MNVRNRMEIAVTPHAVRLIAACPVDEVVVGSGVAGLSVRYEVTRPGSSVMVLGCGPAV
ncbi:hypothetical protein GXW78_18990 [Roseomonas terrae]|uniref:Uncharacterized protein n=1 Tax=Neoroseomonas terrae TaxID=424799 RepID=A0ABS5EL51_9PROT|nr:hypothetical protein [Neoroseomonas terrae]MBR0651763.1 hypothetical protein [Neoroseomonas terrae]